MNIPERKRISALIFNLIRPSWTYALAAFTANVATALFEGSSISFLAVALQVIGGPPEFRLGSSLGILGEWLDRLRLNFGAEHLFLGLVLLAVIAQVLRGGLQYVGEAATAHLQSRVQAQAYNQIFSRIMRLPFQKVSRYPLGNLTYYLNQAEHLHTLFGQLNELARNTLLILIYGALLLWLSWPMTLVALVAYGLVSRLLQRIIRTIERHSSSYTQTAGSLNQSATELLQAIRLIHTFGRQEEAVRKVSTLTQEGMLSRRRAVLWASVIEPMTDVLTVLGAGVFLLGGYGFLVHRGWITLPLLLAFLVALHRVAFRLRSVYSSLGSLSSLAPSIARVSEILEEKEWDEARGGRPFEGLRDSVEFQGVNLRYRPNEPPAVIDLSFRVPQGSFTALVGLSGAGKSTVIDLLLRLFEPTSGEIRVDGSDLRELELNSWRGKLGVVSQEPFLFHASIRENIAFGKPDATLQEIVAAAEAAHAEEFILRLGEGYETIVGDRGFRLSGGQRQRIALARALIRQPEILILDEATSALDSESERWIQAAMDEQRGRRTVLAIAHRLSTVARADQILVLAQGILTEQGTHQELLNRNGLYAHLWRLQSEEHRESSPLLLKEVVG